MTRKAHDNTMKHTDVVLAVLSHTDPKWYDCGTGKVLMQCSACNIISSVKNTQGARDQANWRARNAHTACIDTCKKRVATETSRSGARKQQRTYPEDQFAQLCAEVKRLGAEVATLKEQMNKANVSIGGPAVYNTESDTGAQVESESDNVRGEGEGEQGEGEQGEGEQGEGEQGEDEAEQGEEESEAEPGEGEQGEEESEAEQGEGEQGKEESEAEQGEGEQGEEESEGEGEGSEVLPSPGRCHERPKPLRIHVQGSELLGGTRWLGEPGRGTSFQWGVRTGEYIPCHGTWHEYYVRKEDHDALLQNVGFVDNRLMGKPGLAFKWNDMNGGYQLVAAHNYTCGDHYAKEMSDKTWMVQDYLNENSEWMVDKTIRVVYT